MTALRTYLERIPIDAMTWGESAELERVIAASVEQELEEARAACATEGHRFEDVPVDYYSDDRETRCVRCGGLGPDDESGAAAS